MDALKSLGFEPGALLINIFGFLLLLWLFRRFLYGPIGQFMAHRSDEIKAQVDEARSLHEQAQREHANLQADLQRERDAARAEIAKATQEARAAIEELHAEGRRQRQEIVEQGRLELERAREAALQELRQTVADLAVEISGRLISQSLDERRQDALIEEFLHDIEQAAKQERAG